MTTQNLVWRFCPASEFPRLAATWQYVCDATIRSPLLAADFVGVALRHFSRGNELVCLGESSGNIVAAAVLERKNLLAWQTFQPSQMPLGAWLQPPQTSFREFAASLLRQLPGPAMILAATQLDSDFYPREDSPDCMTLDCITTGRIVLPQDMESLMSSGRVKENSKQAAELMRRMRKAEKIHGSIKLIVETDPESAKDFVNRYAAVESRSWKAEGGTALTPDDIQANFYANLMRQFAQRGGARMYTLKFGEQTVAYQIAVVDNDVLVLLKTTYKPEYRSLGPGVIQMHQIIQNTFGEHDHIRIVELYGRINDSLKLWTTDTRIIYHANVYRMKLLSRIHAHLMKINKRQVF